MIAAAVALLASTVSAFAAGPGVNGTGYATVTDAPPLGYSTADGYSSADDGLGVPAGAIKHVWVITMENHAYESNFTGLDDNSYTSQQLPAAGALLTHYYGTGHSSLDNYITEMSGQSPVTDDQDDCATNTSGSISDGYLNMNTDAAGTDSGLETSGGSLSANPNYGQYESSAGPDAPPGDNGCVYPSTVPTFFNQLDASKVSWKVYAQDFDLTGVYGQNAGTSVCGAPQSTPGSAPSASQASPPDASTSPYYVQGGAAAAGATIGGGNSGTLSVADQYVAKHNPLPWFSSVLNSGDCNSSHIAPLFGSNDQLYNDLQSASSTPSFNFIVPNNCSNGHDAVCDGNNLSGGFNGQVPDSPINNVGGAYSSDKFLAHIVPEIESSPAYQSGGLIVINWDEAYPQFTYSSDSFADSAQSSATAATDLSDDSAGETLFGKSLNWEPSGPNVPNIVSQSGQQVASGPGFDEYLDRPTTSGSLAATSPLVGCTNSPTSANTNGYVTLAANQCYSGGAAGGGDTPTTITHGTLGSNGVVTQNATGTATSGGYSGLVAPNAEGEAVTLPNGVTSSSTNGVYVGQVTSSNPPAAISQTTTDTTAADQAGTVTFQLVDANGNPVSITAGAGALSGTNDLALGSETPANDPLYDAFDGTTGGGDTGAILLSPYIKGGTVSNTSYNHYSLLRSLEDIFSVGGGGGNSAQTGYTGSINVSTGLDGAGHLGYAAQPGLDTFGTDVFTNSPLDTSTSTVTNTVTQPGTSKTVTNTVTTYLPGSIFTVTTPGGTRKVDVEVSVVPKLTGVTRSEAEKLLAAADLKLGKVSGPKAKTGYALVVSGVSPRVGKKEMPGSKVNLTLKLKKG